MVANAESLPEGNDEIQRLDDIFIRQKQAFRQQPFPSASERIKNLDKLKKALAKNADRLVDALNEDFGNRAAIETLMAEVMSGIEGVNYYNKHIRKWMKPVRRKLAPMQMTGTSSAKVVYQPLGVIGIISPWNYPVFLSVAPMIGALAAGNRVMIKMSEFTPRTAETFKEIMADYFNEDTVAVFCGEADVAQAFASKPFDHLLFTGSTSIGHHIMRAAAENLTPVTLELGGKSPALVHKDFPVKDAVERIAFGKCFNAGQTCIAPDYVFCHSSKVDAFVSSFEKLVKKMYPTMKDNDDYTSVINERQKTRLTSYLEDAREKGARVIEINPAGESFDDSGKMPLYVVLDTTEEMDISQNEIFGPIMIVKGYDRIETAIDYINDHSRPLALYYFDYNKSRADRVLQKTHSGGACVNDTLTHGTIEDIPFGGVGHSGMGHYHGYEGFLTFSHAKGVYEKGRFNPARLALPPYNKKIHKMLLGNFLKK